MSGSLVVECFKNPLSRWEVAAYLRHRMGWEAVAARAVCTNWVWYAVDHVPVDWVENPDAPLAQEVDPAVLLLQEDGSWRVCRRAQPLTVRTPATVPALVAVPKAWVPGLGPKALDGVLRRARQVDPADPQWAASRLADELLSAVRSGDRGAVTRLVGLGGNPGLVPRGRDESAVEHLLKNAQQKSRGGWNTQGKILEDLWGLEALHPVAANSVFDGTTTTANPYAAMPGLARHLQNLRAPAEKSTHTDPVHAAVRLARSEDVIRNVLAHAAARGWPTNAVMEDGATPLHWLVARRLSPTCADPLLRSGETLNRWMLKPLQRTAPMPMEGSALRQAIRSGQYEWVRVLLDHGALPDSGALFQAILESKREAFQALYAAGGDPFAPLPPKLYQCVIPAEAASPPFSLLLGALKEERVFQKNLKPVRPNPPVRQRF